MDSSTRDYTCAVRIKASIRKRERNGTAYFSINWSPLVPVSRFDIIGSVPSMAGIWEVYWLQDSRVPRILRIGRAWHGGLRHSLREHTDPSLPMGAPLREYLESGDCYYRYVVVESHADLNDIYSVLITHRRVDQTPVPTTGRYREVRIHEPDEIVIQRRRKPNEDVPPPELYGNEVPNLFDVARLLEEYQQKNDQSTREGGT